MNKAPSLGTRIRIARENSGLTQAEFAEKCRLNIRTIQRIENDQVAARLYTLGILSKVLGTEFSRDEDPGADNGQIRHLRSVFRKRKRIRIVTFVSAICVLLLAFALLLSGIPRVYWAPYVYILLFADLIGIAISWRCPGCNKLLGDAFNQRYCSNCGLIFYDQEGE